MAIKVTKLCDLHIINDEEVEGENIPPVVCEDGLARTVVLDEQCAKTITYFELLHLLENQGQVVEIEKPKRKYRKTAKVQQEPEPEPVSETQCRWCDHEPFGTVRGRKKHEGSMHPEEYEAARAEDNS